MCVELQGAQGGITPKNNRRYAERSHACTHVAHACTNRPQALQFHTWRMHIPCTHFNHFTHARVTHNTSAHITRASIVAPLLHSHYGLITATLRECYGLIRKITEITVSITAEVALYGLITELRVYYGCWLALRVYYGPA